MEKEKLNNPNMSDMDMIMIMSEGNPGATQVLTKMLSNPRGLMDVLLCDSLNIRGSKLYMLYNDCCGKNNDKFKGTLKMFRAGVFDKEQIQANLNLFTAIPFIDDIDDSIIIEGVPKYGEQFGIASEKWDEFCNAQKEAFNIKLDNALNEEQNHLGHKI